MRASGLANKGTTILMSQYPRYVSHSLPYHYHTYDGSSTVRGITHINDFRYSKFFQGSETVNVAQKDTRTEVICVTVNNLRITYPIYICGPTRVSEYPAKTTSDNNTVYVESICSDWSIIKINIRVVPSPNMYTVSELLECGIKLSSHYNPVLLEETITTIKSHTLS